MQQNSDPFFGDRRYLQQQLQNCLQNQQLLEAEQGKSDLTAIEFILQSEKYDYCSVVSSNVHCHRFTAKNTEHHPLGI